MAPPEEDADAWEATIDGIANRFHELLSVDVRVALRCGHYVKHGYYYNLFKSPEGSERVAQAFEAAAERMEASDG